MRTRLGTGEEGLRELARYIQASREAGRFVAVGGMDAALALYEARGEVAKARPLMSKAGPGPRAPHRRARAPWPRWWTRGWAIRRRWWRRSSRRWSWRPRARACPRT
ncbi:hypothetical protein ACN28S_22770 [Cystobacter fuscus]